jgi:hypothetical protein
MLSLGMDLTEKKIKKRIFKYLRPLIKTPNLQLRGNEDEERILELEYHYYFDGDEEQNPIYKVQILNNLMVEPGFIYNSRPRCEFCGVEHADNCDFTFSDKNITFRDILKST